MDTSEQPQNESSNDANGASNALSLMLSGLIPACAVLAVVLIGLIWFKSGCLESAGRTDENEDESLPDQPKYSGSLGREQDQAPPPYEAARNPQGSTAEGWGDDRTICDEGDDHHFQRRGDSRQPTAPSLPSSDTTCLNSKA
jgi:hypothetical protein